MFTKGLLYTLNLIANLLPGLVAIPVIIVHAGEGAWSDVALGTAVGGVLAVLASAGWQLTGPTLVATKSPEAHRELIVVSLIQRITLTVFMVPLAAGVLFITGATDVYLSWLSAMSTILLSQTLSWYYIGRGLPGRLLMLDTLPRGLGTTMGCILILGGGSIEVLPIAQIISSFIAIFAAMTQAKVSAADLMGRATIQQSLRAFRGQLSAISTTGVAVMYTGTPIIIVSALAPSTLAAYALGDRLRQYATLSISPIEQLLMGWAPRGTDPQDQRRRITRSVAVMATIGTACGFAFFMLAPTVAGILSGSNIAVTHELSGPLGIALGMIITSHGTGLVGLNALGRIDAVARSTLIGAVIGVPLLTIGAMAYDAPGVAWALSVSEASVLVAQVVSIFKVLNGRMPQT